MTSKTISLILLGYNDPTWYEKKLHCMHGMKQNTVLRCWQPKSKPEKEYMLCRYKEDVFSPINVSVSRDQQLLVMDMILFPQYVLVR